MISDWVGIVFLYAVILCISITGRRMRRMSVVGHLTAYRSAPFATLGFRGLYAFVCDWVEPLWAKIIWCRVVYEVIDHIVIQNSV